MLCVCVWVCSPVRRPKGDVYCLSLMALYLHLRDGLPVKLKPCQASSLSFEDLHPVCSWLRCWGYRHVPLHWEPELRFTNQAISLDLCHYFKIIFLLKDLHLWFLTVRITAPPHTHFIGNVPGFPWGRWLESSSLTFNSCHESHSRINTCHCQSLILSKLRVWKF